MLRQLFRRSDSPRPPDAAPALHPLLAAGNGRAVPVSWAAASRTQTYVNLGDALSAVMVCAVSGLPVMHAAAKSSQPRLAAVGTIGHGLEGGEVWVWGTGCSAWRNPLAGNRAREAYAPPPNTVLHLCATRGPVSWRLMSGAAPGPDAVFGDPVWFLPRFFPRPDTGGPELGAILHLAELADRATEAHPVSARYDVNQARDHGVALINTVTDISAAAMRARLEEILSCKRLVSTSLHGLVFAESYGIPCLYFTALPGQRGLRFVTLGPDDGLNLRMRDLYEGLGVSILPVYNQPKGEPTDWPDVIRAIDRVWTRRILDEAALLEAFPLPRQPLAAPPGQTLFEHELIAALPFRPLAPAARQ